MWPRSDERGGGASRSLLSRGMTASMWPRSDERGGNSEEKHGYAFQHASMWPRSDERGGTTTRLSRKSICSLQCGRAQMSAEGSLPKNLVQRHPRLQCGRAQMSAEG